MHDRNFAGLGPMKRKTLTIKFAGPGGEQLSVSPMVNPFGSKDEAIAGFQLKIRF